MIGLLPQTLKVCNKDYAIRSDFRDILRIIMAYNDKDLSNQEKVFVCLRRIYKDLDSMPKDKDTYAAAIKAATEFIECRLSDGKPSPKVVNWEKDEQLIFPAINKVAGMEVRAVPFMHWWTFLGYFQAVDREDLWGVVLTIRQKKAMHKKLEKHEQEFFTANRDLCSVDFANERQSPEDQMRAIYESLLKEGGAGNG